MQRYFKFVINKKKDNFICHFGQKYLCGGKAAPQQQKYTSIFCVVFGLH